MGDLWGDGPTPEWYEAQEEDAKAFRRGIAVVVAIVAVLVVVLMEVMGR